MIHSCFLNGLCISPLMSLHYTFFLSCTNIEVQDVLRIDNGDLAAKWHLCCVFFDTIAIL